MRNAFAEEITRLAARDERIVLLSGDIGNRLFNRYKEHFPARFRNCGVAEANMMGVAAGLALCGFRPVVYTIVPFLTARCFEQIKLDVCYHRAPVTLVGVGGGMSYASLGATHHSFEDIAILRVLPNLAVVCPGDAWEVRGALRAALAQDGPVYIRLGKKNEPAVHTAVPDFAIGRALVVREGAGVCLLASGNILPVALGAADVLDGSGVRARVVSMHTVKPLDEALLHDVFSRFAVVASLEEHSLVGGFGAAVAEWAVDHGRDTRGLLRFGIGDRFLHEAGGQGYARGRFGLTAEAVAARVLERWRGS